MLSLASILNPAPPRPVTGAHLCSPPGSSSPEFSFRSSSSIPMVRLPMAEKHKMPKDPPGFSKSQAKGTVRFPPFEDLDEQSLREVRKFRVNPFGGIRNNCRHIPYNSGKKDFFEKTGRESFEVFQYTFKLVNDETEYTVMWDYNVGLVRMTPFFKCCNYPKTTPAKMLNMNPGLRDITHSITGGSIMAQGYWMPYSCAKAVCATFCHHVAGALIPIFGPQFPSECVHPDAPDHGRMSIDLEVIREATREAERFRLLYAEQASLAVSSTPHPLHQRHNNNLQDRMHRYNSSSSYQSRQHFRGGMLLPDSPYGTDTEDYEGASRDPGRGDGDLYRFNRNRYPQTPVRTFRSAHTTAPTSADWTPSNVQHQHPRYQPSDRHILQDPHTREQPRSNASPWLSAIPHLEDYTPQSSPQRPGQYPPALHPRGCHTSHVHLSLGLPHPLASAAPPTPVMSPKRPRGAFESTDTDHEYDGGESHVGSSPTASRTGRDVREGEEEYRLHRHYNHSRSDIQLPPIGVSMTASVAERNAALLLMNLSVADASGGGIGKDSNEKEGETTVRNRLSWMTADIGAAIGLKMCQDERPAKKRRRTISL